MRRLSSCFSLALIIVGTVACTPLNADSNKVASGKVVKLGQQKLILENQGEFLFLDVEASDRERLKSLKKGEHVTLLGKTEKTEQNGHTSTSSEIFEVVQDDGTHIHLGN